MIARGRPGPRALVLLAVLLCWPAILHATGPGGDLPDLLLVFATMLAAGNLLRFEVGLEPDLSTLFKVGGAAVAVLVVGGVLPFSLGDLEPGQGAPPGQVRLKRLPGRAGGWA